MNENIKLVKEHLFEGYFLEDLNSVVNKLDRSKIGSNGHCGYVAIQIIMAGMECLGFISSGGKKDEKAFSYYYDNYFSKTDERYNNTDLKKIFRDTLRNGTAHYFFTKAGITVTLDENQIPHLGLLPTGQNISMNIAVSKLSSDFLKSYDLFKENWLDFELGCKAIMVDINYGQNNVDKYIKNRTNEIKKILEEVKRQSEENRQTIGPSHYPTK